MKSLLDTLVEVRMKKLGLAKGTLAMGKEIAWTKGYLRWRRSSASIKANVSCLLERLVQVEEGSGRGVKGASGPE